MKTAMRTAALAGLLGLATAGCAEEQTQQSATPAPTEEKQTATVVNRLPVSLNALMVAMVNQAADPIWVAAWHKPESDADWRELERRAIQLEVAGALLGVPGTGPLDETWAGSGSWQSWSAELKSAGAEAVRAVHARDLAGISAVGDRIVEICEGCHIEFKPNLPTGGAFGELSPTADDLAETEEP